MQTRYNCVAMKWLTVALFVAIFLEVGAQETPQQNASSAAKSSRIGKHIQQKADKTQKPDSSCSPAPPCIQCCPTEQLHAQTEAEKASAAALDRLYRRYLWATVIGVIGGFIGMIFLLWQNFLLRRSVIAAKKSADTAESAAKFAQNAVRDSERADILLEGVSIIRSRSGVVDGDSQLAFRYKNFGRTRAKNVRFNAAMLIEGVNLPNATQHLPELVMGAGQERDIKFETFRQCLSKTTFEQIMRGEIALRFDSSVIYEDVFGSSYTTRDFGIFDHQARSFRMEQQIAG